MRNLLSVLLIGVFLLSTSACQDPGKSEDELKGVWQFEEARIINSDGQVTELEVQKGLLIFTDSYYSYALNVGNEPRKLPVETWKLTDEEKIAAYNTISFNTGSYERTESRLFLKPILAKAEDFVGGKWTAGYKLEDGSLYFETLDLVSGSGVPIPGTAGSRFQVKLARKESPGQMTSK